jgi:hypothetical protein
MKSSNRSGNVWVGMGILLSRRTVFLAALVAVCLGLARLSSAQVVPSADMGGFTLVAGATASGYDIQYGQQKLLGVAAVVDVDTRRRFGFEGEARWLQYHQANDVHVTDWLAGPRYHFSRGKFQYYVKGLAGVGQFQFPYDYAHGTYLVIAPGGGVDYRWRRKVSFRLADFEYQYWPQFTYGAMTTFGVSAGVRYHIF